MSGENTRRKSSDDDKMLCFNDVPDSDQTKGDDFSKKRSQSKPSKEGSKTTKTDPTKSSEPNSSNNNDSTASSQQKK